MKKLLILLLLSVLWVSCDSDPCDDMYCDYDETCVIVQNDDYGDEDPFTVLFGDSHAECVPDHQDLCDGVYCGANSHCVVEQCDYDNPCYESVCECDEGYFKDSYYECIKVEDLCENTYCGEGTKCDPETGYCEPISCRVDLDCEDGFICNPATHNCEKGNEKDCISNSDCSGGLVCNQGTQTCEESACNLVDCIGNETCIIDNNNNASCICGDGFEIRNGNCVSISSCDEITCSDKGACSVLAGKPVCNCDNGYYAEGRECLVDPCYEVTCSGHGACSNNNGTAECGCEDGFHVDESDSLNCIADDPCDGVTCSDHGVCNSDSGEAVCSCNHGFNADGLSCIEAIHQSLRIELTWDKAGDLDLHLRKPGEDDTAWGTNRDCYYDDCSDWYVESDYNPNFLIDDSMGTGPEIISIDKITPSTEPFTIAVHNRSNTDRPTATVKIYCNDILNSQFTTVIPNYGSQAKSFWKVSNLVLTADNFCETSPLGLDDYPGED